MFLKLSLHSLSILALETVFYNLYKLYCFTDITFSNSPCEHWNADPDDTAG